MADLTSTKKKGSYHQIRDQYHYIEISMYNQIDNQPPLNVPFFLVDSLKIHESIYNWSVKGEIVFNTDFEIFSRGALATGTNTFNSDKNIKAPYIDRTDGRNRLHITIYPVDITNVNGNIIEDKSNNTKFPKKYWELDMDFVIADFHDIPVDNAQRKKRMYVFIDEHHQILKEKNLEWSSAMFAAKLKGGTAATMGDAEAAINPHDILKEFISHASTNGETMPKINIGFNESGSIDKPNIPFDKIIEDEWDKGDPSNQILMYPTSNSNGIQDIYYILSHCSSSDGFPVIFDYGRSSEDKGWKLHSLSSFFKNSKKEQVERLILEDGLESVNPDGSSTTTPYVARADGSGASQTNNFSSLVASRISSYKYSPMASLDDARIMNSPLVYFNEHTGEFVYKKEQNTVQKLIEKLKELAGMGLYNFKDQSNGQILLNLNKTKTEGQMTINKFALNGPFSCQTSPLNQMIFDAIFLNQSLSFQLPGLTLRSPGKFVFIDRVGAGEKNAFDDRFLGQWMITNVSHLFTQGEYITEVVCSKIDSFSQIYPENEMKH